MIKRFHQKLKEKVNLPIIWISFICFVVIFIWLIIFKYNHEKAINLLVNQYKVLSIHDRFMFQFTRTYTTLDTFGQIFLNIPVFIPLTLYMPLLFKKENIIRDLLISLLTTFAIEIFQLLTAMGGFELLDLLMNMIGAGIGCLIFKLLRKHTPDVVINYINLFICITCVPLALYAIINTAINFSMYMPLFS